jgi:hypothetical protein
MKVEFPLPPTNEISSGAAMPPVLQPANKTVERSKERNLIF